VGRESFVLAAGGKENVRMAWGRLMENRLERRMGVFHFGVGYTEENG
jgi:hypothetical protein